MTFPIRLYFQLAEERRKLERSAEALTALLLTQPEGWDELQRFSCISSIRFQLDDTTVNIACGGTTDDLDDVLAALFGLGFKMTYGDLPAQDDRHWGKYLSASEGMPQVYLMWDRHETVADPAPEARSSLADLLTDNDTDDDIPF